MSILRSQLDTHTVRVFCAVAESGSFTRAGERVGLTQSAVSRQIQALEELAGLKLFERTTRKVNLTSAGEFFLKEAGRWIQGLERSFEEMQERFADAPRRFRVGVSQSIGFAYLPGFFSAYRRKHPQDRIEVNYDSGRAVLEKVADGENDIGICAVPTGKSRGLLPRSLDVTHRFADRFVAIVPPKEPVTEPGYRLLDRLAMIAFSAPGATRDILDSWRVRLKAKPDGAVAVAMEAGSFDLVINLVSMGFGWSVVPKRALAIYGRRKPVIRIDNRILSQAPPERELVVVVRTGRANPEYLRDFIDDVLF